MELINGIYGEIESPSDEKRGTKVLFDKTYGRYRALGITYGTHPCCYICLPDDEMDREKDEYYYDAILDVHGGITFCGAERQGIIGNWIGWDYSHLGDYYYIDPKITGHLPRGHIYSISELIKDCERVIKVLYENESGGV